MTKVEDFLENKSANDRGDREIQTKPWYYVTISKKETEGLMAENGKIGDFLIRESELIPGDYVLSLERKGKNKTYPDQKEKWEVFNF